MLLHVTVFEELYCPVMYDFTTMYVLIECIVIMISSNRPQLYLCYGNALGR